MVLFVANSFALTKNFTFSVAKEGTVAKEIMIVKQETHSTQIIRIEPNGEKQVIKLKGKTKILSVTYFDTAEQAKITVSYDYKNTQVTVIAGNKKKKFPLSERTFEAQSVFYMLGHIYPKKDGEFEFTLLQSWGPRIVDMYLKDMDTETIQIMGRKIKARKYEMGLLGAIESTIWPHRYYYWYDADNRRILKYQGRNENSKEETIELVDYSEEK